MAEIQKAIKIGDIYTNLVEPSTGKSVNYKEVTDWYDGTPMDDSKVDGELYRKVENTYVRKVIDKDGELFLEKDTMDEMRNLSSLEVLMLKAGVYKGVTLNGYYEAGDTPSSIDYLLSTTSGADDGFSVFEVGDIKLTHDFKGVLNINYAGVFGDGSTDVHPLLQNVLNRFIRGTIKVPVGTYLFSETLTIPTNAVYVIQGEGRKSAGGDTGLVRFNYIGQTSDYAISIDNPQSGGRSRVDIKDIAVVNSSGREDVDGLLCRNLTGSLFDSFSLTGFRDNLVVYDYFYYNVITNCSFERGLRHGVNCYSGTLLNGTTFEKCRMSLNKGFGFYSEGGLGEVCTFKGNWIEVNDLGGLRLRRSYTSIIEGNYFEFNSGVNIELFSNSAFGNASNIMSSIRGNKFRSRNGVNILGLNPTDTTKIQVIFEGNVIENNDIEIEGENSYVFYSSHNTNNVFVTLIGNTSTTFENKGKVLFSNRENLDFFGGFTVIEDALLADLKPDTGGNYLNSNINIASGKNIRVLNINQSDPDSSPSHLNITFPSKVASNAGVRIGRGTTTTGDFYTSFESGNSIRAYVDHNKGTVESVLGFTAHQLGKIGVYFTGVNPEGNIEAPQNSLCLSPTGVYRKEGSGNTGWVLLTPDATPTVKGLVNQATASPDTVEQASGATPTKEEFDDLLSELRDLKTKMRTAGLLEE